MFDLCTCVASLGALLVALPARASASVDEVSAIETHADDRGGTVVLRGTHPPVFSVFRLSAPDRIVVDLAGADVSKARVPRSPGFRAWLGISAVQFQKGETLVGRVVLSAAPAVAYDVKVAGNDVVVALSGNVEGAQGLGGLCRPGLAAATVLAPDEPRAPSHPAPTRRHRRPPTIISSNASSIETNGMARGRAFKVGHRILAAEAQLGNEPFLSIRTDGPAGDVTVLRLRDPSRIAVDLSGFAIRGAKVPGVHGSEVFASASLRAGPAWFSIWGSPKFPRSSCAAPRLDSA